LSSSWIATDRAYRLSIRRGHFTETHLRILDVILFYSSSRGRPQAMIPKQRFFEILCGLDKGEVSRAMEWLETKGVIERGGGYYAIIPPPWIAVDARVDLTREVVDLERWLENLDPQQPDLLPPPPSLHDAMREVFADAAQPAATGAAPVRVSPGLSESSRGRGREVESESSWIGSKSNAGSGPAAPTIPEVGQYPTGSRDPAYKTGPGPSAVGEYPTPRSEAVGEYPTFSRTRETSSRELENSVLERPNPSREPSTRSREACEGERKGLEYRCYVETRLFQVIGEHERAGQCALMWRRAVRDIPEELDELISQGVMLKKTGDITRSIGAWLNRSVYRALQERASREMPGG
jgi:hypothetical protein